MSLLKFYVHSPSSELRRRKCSQVMSTARILTFMSTRPRVQNEVASRPVHPSDPLRDVSSRVECTPPSSPCNPEKFRSNGFRAQFRIAARREDRLVPNMTLHDRLLFALSHLRRRRYAAVRWRSCVSSTDCAPSGDDASPALRDAFVAITDDVQRAFAITCERCGGPGPLQRTRHWAKALCHSCAEPLGYAPWLRTWSSAVEVQKPFKTMRR